MKKINVFRIVRDHFGTLRDYQTGKLSVSDLIVFMLCPLIAAFACVYKSVSFDKDALIAVLTAFSIFAGLLFSLLLLVFTLTDKTEPQSMLYSVRRQLIGELYENISFAILVSMAIVTLAIGAATFRHPAPVDTGTGWLATFLLVLFMSNFILTILMILKRMHALLTLALKEQPAKKRA
jgi:drug/metabolite transporter (DMT)-like permease